MDAIGRFASAAAHGIHDAINAAGTPDDLDQLAGEFGVKTSRA
jgi:hypothetical protein